MGPIFGSVASLQHLLKITVFNLKRRQLIFVPKVRYDTSFLAKSWE